MEMSEPFSVECCIYFIYSLKHIKTTAADPKCFRGRHVYIAGLKKKLSFKILEKLKGVFFCVNLLL